MAAFARGTPLPILYRFVRAARVDGLDGGVDGLEGMLLAFLIRGSGSKAGHKGCWDGAAGLGLLGVLRLVAGVEIG